MVELVVADACASFWLEIKATRNETTLSVVCLA